MAGAKLDKFASSVAARAFSGRLSGNLRKCGCEIDLAAAKQNYSAQVKVWLRLGVVLL